MLFFYQNGKVKLVLMVADTYLTIAHPSEGLYKEKGSRFISFAFPVQNEEAIKEILASIRKEHFSARHCCFAWNLGVEQQRFRTNDDGEPQGTAGRPIYGQIQSNKLTNVIVVVVRYFGGTLLGVSGLIRAYKQAAVDAIANATVVTRVVEHIVEVAFAYPAMNNLMQLIKEEQLEIVTSNYDLQCSVSLKIRVSRLEEIETKIRNIEGVRDCKIRVE